MKLVYFNLKVHKNILKKSRDEDFWIATFESNNPTVATDFPRVMSHSGSFEIILITTCYRTNSVIIIIAIYLVANFFLTIKLESSQLDVELV